MKYFLKALEFNFGIERGKRFLILFPILLPAGLAIALTVPNGVWVEFVKNFSSGNFDFIAALGFFGVNPPLRTLIAGVIAFILTAFGISVVSSIIARAMRVGVFRLNGLFSEFNESFLPTITAVFTYSLAAFFLKVLLTVLLVLWQTVNNSIGGIILSLLSVVAVYALLAAFMAIGKLYLPYMVINGRGSASAFTTSIGKCGGKTMLRLFLADFVPLMAGIICCTLIGLAGNRRLQVAADTIFYTALLVYQVSLAFISYYDINSLVREDYTREYYFRKNRLK